MATIPTPSGECLGIDVSVGGQTIGSYDAKGGFVDVDNSIHAKAIRRMVGSRKLTGFSQVSGPTAAPSAACSGCGGDYFEFQLLNGRCRRCR